MKNVLLLVHDDSGQVARFQTALDLTRLVDGHLTCLDVAVPPPALVDHPGGEIAGVTLLMDEIHREDLNRSRLQQRLAIEDLSWDWQDAVGRMARSIDGEAAFADVIIMNRRLDAFAGPDMRGEVGEVLVRAGRPVLAVPDHSRAFDPHCALVAWDGSRGAMTAMRAAIPILKYSQRVVLTEIAEQGTNSEIERAAQYLSRYDIHARVDRVSAGQATVGEILIDEATRHDARLIVAGGYGNSRLHEALFGGVTRTLLTHAPCAVFIAH